MEINGTARRIDVPLTDFAGAINQYIKKLQPDMIISHGSNGEYGHPQHVYTHQAARMALSNGHPDIAFLSWCAWYEPSARQRILNEDDRADIINDISPWHDKKVHAAMCHRTQHAMFLRNSGAASVPEMVWKTETFHIWQGSLPEDL